MSFPRLRAQSANIGANGQEYFHYGNRWQPMLLSQTKDEAEFADARNLKINFPQFSRRTPNCTHVRTVPVSTYRNALLPLQGLDRFATNKSHEHSVNDRKVASM